METIRIALATDDGTSFTDHHFGDALYYDIYDIQENSERFIKRIENTVKEDEEKTHGEQKKAQGIMGLLKQEGVQGAVSRVFGPNIKHIRHFFVCIVIRNTGTHAQALTAIQKNLEAIRSAFAKEEEKNIVSLTV